MSKIEKAIKHFEGLQKRYKTSHNGQHCELVKAALEALLEKQERMNGCEYCRTGKRKLVTQPDGTFVRHTRYCDECGKRLEVDI